MNRLGSTHSAISGVEWGYLPGIPSDQFCGLIRPKSRPWLAAPAHVQKEDSKMFIQRDFTRTMHDDFVLNVQPKLTDTTETVPVYHDGQVVGWNIKGRYE